MAMMALQIPPDCDLCFCGRCSSSSSGGGGGGGGSGFRQQYYQGHGEPNTVGFLPDDQTIPNLYTDLNTQINYDWVPGELRWV